MRGEGVTTSAFYVPELKQVLTASWDTTARLFGPMAGEAKAVTRGEGVVASAFYVPELEQVLVAS